MVNSHVTITLGRSGQKVVKESWGDPASGRDNVHWSSGSKRSMVESFGSSAEYSSGANKSTRGEFSSRSYGSGNRFDAGESQLRPNDLRLKLTRKRISRLAQLNGRVYRRNELHNRVPRAAQSLELSVDNAMKREPPSRVSTGPSMMGSMASSYSSWPSSGVARISNPRSTTDELSRVPVIRPMGASHSMRVPMNHPFDPYRPKPPIPVSRQLTETERLVRELPPATVAISRPPTQENQPITVSGLLLSLGLEKYCINFQAEEIDMTALKQMGETDLKDLGIPMGPRKKILLNLQAQARARRPIVALPINHIQ